MWLRIVYKRIHSTQARANPLAETACSVIPWKPILVFYMERRPTAQEGKCHVQYQARCGFPSHTPVAHAPSSPNDMAVNDRGCLGIAPQQSSGRGKGYSRADPRPPNQIQERARP